MSHKSAIANLTHLCTRYMETDVQDGETLSELLRDISGILFYLETVRAYYHNKWSAFVNDKITAKMSVARAQVEADVRYPELYELRRTMDAAYTVVNAIRTNISYLKSEIHNSK